MAVTKIKGTSSFTNLTKYDSFLAGNNINDYESIATTTVGAGGAATVTFSSIPSTYQHLQIRGLGQSSRATFGFDDVILRFNGDTGTNYARHYLGGSGSAAYSGAANTPSSYIYTDSIIGSSTAGTSFFGGFVMDILDYASTNKNKTVRTLGGTDLNGTVGGEGGRITLNSGLWFATPAAITSVVLSTASGTNFNQYSSFALYGIRG
ncbi:hypothetical protein UFOVP404_4 [uncultured Caudovirales phage]|uniref:Uncharacterized protein n=1 Tax=uncultured Caudovirales phage TaxID=2100421 RepID=A0A6J5M4K0_9CAUD|nr:hypothetical protein UFOVP404_4 [uncultured Caudovirales phage]